MEQKTKSKEEENKKTEENEEEKKTVAGKSKPVNGCDDERDQDEKKLGLLILSSEEYE